MNQIRVLEQETIDKIAAGEVVERPASVVKELVENSIDANASSIAVEIRDGGISLIRITDNGGGIPKEQVETAFLRHATSKIRSVDDLSAIRSLGFRGEALSSIAAVAQVELITKTSGSLTGIRYRISGGSEEGKEEIGAPEGSTFLIRNLFYNTPARKKFLKTAATEAGYVSDLMEHLALSHPEISFKFINNGQVKLHTSGNKNLKDIIYSIYGREIASNLVEIDVRQDEIQITGFIGKPLISRGNRNFENYFVNGRYVKNNILAKAIEEGYKSFLMQHRYPFTVLKLQIDGNQVDVNVHPTKMELRFADNPSVYQVMYEAIKNALSQKELIPKTEFGRETKEQSVSRSEDKKLQQVPEPFEKIRNSLLAESKSPYQIKYPQRDPLFQTRTDSETAKRRLDIADILPGVDREAIHNKISEKAATIEINDKTEKNLVTDNHFITENNIVTESNPAAENLQNTRSEQLNLFEQKLLDPASLPQHKLIGQIFDTYWIVQFQDNLYIIDQHAAHEKVMYERLTNSLKNRTHTSQRISPPIIISLSMQEENLFQKYETCFTKIGFEIEHFGGREYAICAVPDNLFGLTEQKLFLEMLDSLSESSGKPSADLLNEKLATMACKSAVKGNTRLNPAQADELIRELLSLENPYNCPHGRPTIISMSKYELERKFKRIV